MAKTWRSIKASADFNKGRDALRGDRLAGSYNACQFAKFDVPHNRARHTFVKEQHRIERQQTADYNAILPVLNRVNRTRVPKVYGKAKRASVIAA